MRNGTSSREASFRTLRKCPVTQSSDVPRSGFSDPVAPGGLRFATLSPCCNITRLRVSLGNTNIGMKQNTGQFALAGALIFAGSGPGFARQDYRRPPPTH